MMVVHLRPSWHKSSQVVQGLQFLFQGVLLIRVKLEPLPAPEQGSVLKHGDGLGVESPVGALARPGGMPRYLDEAVVEAEVVPEGVLPALGVLPVVREVVHDELVDLGEGQHPLLTVVEGHRGECYVGVGGL